MSREKLELCYPPVFASLTLAENSCISRDRLARSPPPTVTSVPAPQPVFSAFLRPSARFPQSVEILWFAGRCNSSSPRKSHQTSLSDRCEVAKNQQAEVDLERLAIESRPEREEPAASRKNRSPRNDEHRRTSREVGPPPPDRSDDVRTGLQRRRIEFMQALDAYKRASGRMFPRAAKSSK